MKRSILFLLLTGLVGFLFTGCLEDDCDRTEVYVQYDPVLVHADSIRPGIEVLGPREMCNPGNIYYYKGYLLINERGQGIHVINNSDPANPVRESFIKIPGNRDMAVYRDVLYADLYLDLVAIDISDPANIEMIGRTDGVFTHWYTLFDQSTYIVDYVPTEKTVEVSCDDPHWGSPWIRIDMAVLALIDVNFTAGTQDFAEATGIGGSMARFTMSKGHLYTIDEWQMRVFDLEMNDPQLINTISVSWGIETLFPYGDYLFIGANNGMYIYNNTDPKSPSYLSQFAHVQSCDPVFVRDDIAFVTLRDGNACQGFVNQLDVIDVSDMSNPRLLKSYPMENPHGLSVTENTLYLCEGRFGFKVFDISDVDAIDKNLLSHNKAFHGFDVIVLPGDAAVMAIGEDGLYQFDPADRTDLRELSKIEINCL